MFYTLLGVSFVPVIKNKGHNMSHCICYFHTVVLKTVLYLQHVNKSKVAKIIFVSTSRKEENSVQIGLRSSKNQTD